MPALHRALALLLAPMLSLAYEPLSRRRIAGLAAATTLAPRIARADEPAVDAEMLANISPLAALALCGGMILPMRLGMTLTFGTFLVSDAILNIKYGFSIFTPYRT